MTSLLPPELRRTIRQTRRGFTLIELLVSTAVFVVMVGLLFSVISQVASVWRSSSGKVEAFQGSRLAYDLMTRNLGQATLNTCLDYLDSGGNFLSSLTTAADRSTFRPHRYVRRSDLHFVSGPAGGNLPGTPGTGSAVFFQAPAVHTEERDPGGNLEYSGLDDALNVCGYYIEFGSDTSFRPGFLPGTVPARYRYRLMQLLVPLEKNEIFTTSTATDFSWFNDFTSSAQPVADNIIALIVQPQDPGDDSLFTTSYDYNSRANATTDPQPITAHQLPPVMRVTLVAIDEASANRLASGSSEPTAIAGALAGKFTNPATFPNDLKDLEEKLVAAKINYRIFSSAVPIRESKWSKK